MNAATPATKNPNTSVERIEDICNMRKRVIYVSKRRTLLRRTCILP